ncbi:hypothetical protein [Oceanobacillus oncorhynchi]|uniref:hypothetical protein n=1 Tax=Oceanobacillus oncorhynchi TaxID=545501 RepID=UPI0034D6AB48
MYLYKEPGKNDIVIGYCSKNNVLLTLMEQKAHHKIVRKIQAKKTEVTKALELLLEGSVKFLRAFNSITADNSSEFSELWLNEERKKEWRSISLILITPLGKERQRSNTTG